MMGQGAEMLETARIHKTSEKTIFFLPCVEQYTIPKKWRLCNNYLHTKNTFDTIRIMVKCIQATIFFSVVD